MKRVATKARNSATNQILAEKLQSDPDFYTEYRRKTLQGKGIEE
jgi:hypothetical protein